VKIIADADEVALAMADHPQSVISLGERDGAAGEAEVLERLEEVIAGKLRLTNGAVDATQHQVAGADVRHLVSLLGQRQRILRISDGLRPVGRITVDGA